MIFARFQKIVQHHAHKGAITLVRAGTVGVLAAIGAGLITAALLMTLAMLIGAIWASLTLGVVFLALAAAMMAQPKTPPPPPIPVPPLEEVIFTLGFVAARALLRERQRNDADSN